MNRPTCVACSLKHLGQARALLKEVRKGYPQHWAYAIGHMAEAEDELVEDYPSLASTIRLQRKILELNPDFVPPWGKLVVDIMAQTGYSISQEDTLHMKFNRWLKHVAPLAAIVFACSCLGGSIEQPDKTRTDAEISGIASGTVVDVAVLATMLGLPNGATTIRTGPDGSLIFTVVTKSENVYVSATNGAIGYNGLVYGLELGPPAWESGDFIHWSADAVYDVYAVENTNSISAPHEFRVFLSGPETLWSTDRFSIGELTTLPAEVYSRGPPAVGSFTLDWRPLTNEYYFYPNNSGVTTNHTVAVGDVFYVTNGCVKAITVAP